MAQLQHILATGIPFDEPNVDTNQLCPTRFNKIPRGPAFARILFHDRRFDAHGNEKPDFILNQSPYREGGIIVADRNFGCGSSRETAVYGLAEFGIKAVIASSFGDIFTNNCYKNRLLPVILDNDICLYLRGQLHSQVGAQIDIDLARQIVRGPDNEEYAFDIHPLRKKSLIEGVDDIALTKGYIDDILRFEARYRQAFPWLNAHRVN